MTCFFLLQVWPTGAGTSLPMQPPALLIPVEQQEEMDRQQQQDQQQQQQIITVTAPQITEQQQVKVRGSDTLFIQLEGGSFSSPKNPKGLVLSFKNRSRFFYCLGRKKKSSSRMTQD